MKTAIVTFVYPKAEKFLPDFLENLKIQTAKSFNIIFFNDGLLNLKRYLIDYKIKSKSHIFDLTGDIGIIRFKSINILKDLDFDNYIFQDVDDLMSPNRVEECNRYLESYDFVVNDLNLIDSNGYVLCKNYWSNRLANEFKFKSNFLVDCNFAGLGNTSIKNKILKIAIQHSSKVIAVDWFLFYQLLFLSQGLGIFINSAVTLYRQHDSNTIGLSEINEARIKRAKKVKELHYKELVNSGYKLQDNLKRLEQSQIIDFKKINNHKNHFWWEETVYLI